MLQRGRCGIWMGEAKPQAACHEGGSRADWMGRLNGNVGRLPAKGPGHCDSQGGRDAGGGNGGVRYWHWDLDNPDADRRRSVRITTEDVQARIGDSTLPMSPVEGGSWTAASNGSAVQAACEAVKHSLFKQARKMANSPLADASFEDVEVRNRRIFRKDDPARGLSVFEVMHAAELHGNHRAGQSQPEPAADAEIYQLHEFRRVRGSARG